MSSLLEVHDLVTRFYTQDGIVHAVNGVSFSLEEGQSLAIVGESGSGKTVTALSILGLVPSPPGVVESGQVLYRGQDLLQLSDRRKRKIRGREIAMIFQDPMTSLNPVLKVGRQIVESLRLHLGYGRKEAHARAVELLDLVGIPNPEERMEDYPQQFSGGQRQRVIIAIALACNPSLLIADEPTTALDVTIQAQIVSLIKRLKEQLGMAVIWITHDLGVIAGLVDEVAVMYAGRIVEEAPVRALYKNPTHPYTQGLLHSIPRIDAAQRVRLQPINGLPPDMLVKPQGCAFAPRCDFVVDHCRLEEPPLSPVGSYHRAACWEWESVRGREVVREMA